MAEAGNIRDAASALVAALKSAGMTVTTAESCTGGWIAKAITDVAGSSAVFAYGIVSYSNGAKKSLLGVDGKALAKAGAVSEPVVIQMAEGALEVSGADLSVAVSGIAGPDGGSEAKPVGTVWFAWSRRSGTEVATKTDRQCFRGDREAVRRQAVLHALRGIRGTLPA